MEWRFFIKMPLSLLNAGDTAQILNIKGKEEQRQFLSNLGFIVGDKLTVVSNNSGDMILVVKESRVAVGKDLTTKIIVRPS